MRVTMPPVSDTRMQRLRISRAGPQMSIHEAVSCGMSQNSAAITACTVQVPEQDRQLFVSSFGVPLSPYGLPTDSLRDWHLYVRHR